MKKLFFLPALITAAITLAAGTAFAVSLLTEDVSITVPEPISIDAPTTLFNLFPGETRNWSVNVTNSAPVPVDIQFVMGEVLNSSGQPAPGFTLAGATGAPYTIPAGQTHNIEVAFTAANGIPADTYIVSVEIMRP